MGSEKILFQVVLGLVEGTDVGGFYVSVLLEQIFFLEMFLKLKKRFRKKLRYFWFTWWPFRIMQIIGCIFWPSWVFKRGYFLPISLYLWKRIRIIFSLKRTLSSCPILYIYIASLQSSFVSSREESLSNLSRIDSKISNFSLSENAIVYSIVSSSIISNKVLKNQEIRSKFCIFAY